MASHSCINGTLDVTNYSSPVPVIGLYIAGATLVCMFLMICDIVVGCYSRKRWLPCKMFKLDSITLTLVSVVVKLTVDLTTPMPNVLDQLSKLCGTSLLCAYMAFIMPSVAVMNDSTNMYSLSILVITVFVNMCIQISTGVVVLFIPEHIIILCIMLTMLGLLWCCAWNMKLITRRTGETSKNLFRRGEESVLKRLKVCYLYSYGSDTQLLACKDINPVSFGVLNLFCLVILIQAANRSVIKKSEKLCIGNSDYEWSMPIIVVTQILTVIVGTSVSLSRWLTMTGRIDLFYTIEVEAPYESNPTFRYIQLKIAQVQVLIHIAIIVITCPVSILAWLFSKTIDILKSGNNEVKTKIESVRTGLEERTLGKLALTVMDEWTLGKGLTEMKKEIKVNKSDESNDLFQLLSKISPSQRSKLMEHISDRVDHLDGDSIRVSTLLVVVLVKIAQVSLPKNLNRSLVKTFRQVNEFLCFIEKNLFLGSPEFTEKLEMAQKVWSSAKNFRYLVDKTFDEYATHQRQPQSNCALAIIAEVKSKKMHELENKKELEKKTKKIIPEDMVYYSELCFIVDFINRQQYSSVKELYDYIEQLYVDMLHVILAQFPIATFNALSTESTSEDYQGRVRFALKFVCKIKPLESQIQWKFPQGSNLIKLVTTPVLAIKVQTEDSTATVAIHGDNHAIIEVQTEDSTATVAIHDDNDVTIEVETEDSTATVAIHVDNDEIIEVEDSNLRTV